MEGAPRRAESSTEALTTLLPAGPCALLYLTIAFFSKFISEREQFRSLKKQDKREKVTWEVLEQKLKPSSKTFAQ